MVVPTIIPLQLSVVVGGFVILTSHSPIISVKMGIVGAVVSSTITLCFVDEELPFESVNIQVFKCPSFPVFSSLMFLGFYSKCSSFQVSKCPCFKVYTFPVSEAVKFPSFNKSKFPSFQPSKFPS